MPIGTLFSVSLDCSDPQPLADFWAKLLGGTIGYTSEQFTVVEAPTGGRLSAYRVDDYQPPAWPEGSPPKQLHLEIAVTDLDESEQAAIGLGATKAAHQPQPDRWRVLLDPAGHPFCLFAM